jgi:hypothetical protein
MTEKFKKLFNQCDYMQIFNENYIQVSDNFVKDKNDVVLFYDPKELRYFADYRKFQEHRDYLQRNIVVFGIFSKDILLASSKLTDDDTELLELTEVGKVAYVLNDVQYNPANFETANQLDEYFYDLKDILNDSDFDTLVYVGWKERPIIQKFADTIAYTKQLEIVINPDWKNNEFHHLEYGIFYHGEIAKFFVGKISDHFDLAQIVKVYIFDNDGKIIADYNTIPVKFMQNLCHLLNVSGKDEWSSEIVSHETELKFLYDVNFTNFTKLVQENEVPDYAPTIFHRRNRNIYEFELLVDEVTEDMEPEFKYFFKNENGNIKAILKETYHSI